MEATRKILAAFILLLALHSGALSQRAPLDSLVKKFSEYRDKTLQEKIYAHTDQTFYLTGETLWFKLYVVDGSIHAPLGVSSVAYAELLDGSEFPVLQAKISLKNGFGSGSFFLPASLSSGNYKLRVYTNWMKNFGPEFFFVQQITIINPFVVPKAPAASAHTYTVDFFPEGGYLVGGLKSIVGFKEADGFGNGLTYRGFVVNGSRDTVASFAPGKFGLGHFAITPRENEQYKAVIIGPGGVRTIHDFPKVQPAGYVMQLVDSGDQVVLNVRTHDVTDTEILLFVHARHIVSHALRQTLSGNQATFVLKKSELAEGISHLTIFNEQLLPVCERLYFTQPEKKLSINLKPNQKIYNARQKVSVTIETSKDGGHPAPASMSVAVYKIDSLGHEPVGISPYLWLTSDLAGPIECPNDYFDNTSNDMSGAMDDLMLTQGWRRFKWNDILGEEKKPEFLPEVNGHIIRGVVKKDGQPQSSVFTYLGSPGKIVRAYGSWSSAEGKVQYEIKDFYGPRKIILMTQADSTHNFTIQLANPFSTGRDKLRLPPLMLDAKLKNALSARSIAMQVQDIYYYEQYGNRFAKPEVDSMAFYGKADATYYLDDYTRFPVMEEVMREYVPGVFVRKRRDGFHFLVVDIQNKGVLSGDPMILLDGVPVLDTDDIMRVDPLTVKKLEVIQREYFLGQAVFSGIVSYTTYKGDLGNLQLDPRSISLNYDGLQLRREFHSPEYSYRDSRERMPDQRHLLYWNPDVTTNSDGQGQIEFYTSDVDGSYAIVVQGIDKYGYSGTATATFITSGPDDQ
ncbi:MAG TPA: hypothetical protein VFI14_08430 [Chryseosolibacter sp.]|nr:hypothetical protein [Chryseosolibacter sp.]